MAESSSATSSSSITLSLSKWKILLNTTNFKTQKIAKHTRLVKETSRRISQVAPLCERTMSRAVKAPIWLKAMPAKASDQYGTISLRKALGPRLPRPRVG